MASDREYIIGYIPRTQPRASHLIPSTSASKNSRKHFTQFGMEHGAGHALADPDPVKLMNPMSYIGVKGISVAKHWRIRHGTVDRDTSIAIPVMLATRLQNSGCNVDFELP